MTNPYAPPQAIVEDIVQAPGEIVLAERLTRLGAAILDNVIVLVAVYAPLMLVIFGDSSPGPTSDDDGVSPVVLPAPRARSWGSWSGAGSRSAT